MLSALRNVTHVSIYSISVYIYIYLQCMCYKILKAEGLSGDCGFTSCVVFAAQRLQTSESARNCALGFGKADQEDCALVRKAQ